MAKITGPDKATGQQHTAAEYNAMKNSINAIYDALFTNGVIGKIQNSALPPVDLLPLFDPEYYQKGNNLLIQPKGSPQTGVTPTAPTVTVTGRKSSAVHIAYPGQLEYRNSGGAWANYADNVLVPVTDNPNAMPANFFEFRVKADIGTNRNAGLIAGSPSIPAEGGGSGGNYIDPEAMALPLNHETEAGKSFTENPTGVFAATSGGADSKYMTNLKMNVNSWVALKKGSIESIVGIGGGGDGIYLGTVVFIRFNASGQAMYGQNDGSGGIVSATQPTANGFIAMKAISGRLFKFYVVEGTGESAVWTEVGEVDKGYDVIANVARIKGSLGLIPAKAYYPQGKGLEVIEA